MCGIVGCNFKTDLNNVLHILHHRGPDYQSFKIYNNFSFGHTRLSIIDLDKEANQPMEIDEYILIFNGEIYNYKELIKRFNLKVKTKSDSEVIIRMYQKFKEKCINYFNGMFAFCIFDKKNKKIFCARDKFGKKPFFYYFKNNKFIFASEIKAILKLLNFTPKINYEALIEYLRFWSPLFDKTIYKDIQKLPAGHYLIYENKILKIKKYYDIDNIKIKVFEEREALENIERLLINSVNLRLVSDVEVASLLSGGIDSSLISAIYSKLKGKINTFSIGYDEYLEYDERNYAKKVAKHINSNHYELVISKKEYLENIDNVLNSVDEPFGDSATIPTLILSKFIHSKGIKVALSGEGSDENFLGYDNYFKIFEYDKLKIKHLEKFNLTKDWEYKKRKFFNEKLFLSTGEAFTNEQLKKLLKNYKEITLAYNANYVIQKWVSFADFKYWIENVLLTKIDRASMANSLEIRAPFLDYELVEYVLGIDPKIKISNTNKYLLKKIAIKYLPKEIVYRKKKGFSSPFIEWLFDEYKENLLKDILKVNKETNYFNEDFVKFLYNEAKEKRFKQHFYLLYIFSRWFKKVYL